MKNLATTRMSSKGQVVIPEAIRKRLGLSEGVEFVVIGNGDAIILKAITAPDPREFKELISEARRAAKKAKLTQTDVKSAINKARKR